MSPIAEYDANSVEDVRREISHSTILIGGCANSALESILIDAVVAAVGGDRLRALQSLSRAVLVVREAGPIELWQNCRDGDTAW